MNSRTFFLCAAACGFFALSAEVSAQAGGQPPPMVNTAKVEMIHEEGTRQYIGKLTSVHQVDLTARVSGYLNDVLSREGDMVKEGDTVMLIEDTLYSAKVKSAEAKVSQKKVELDYAKTNFSRQKELIGISATSEMDEAKRLLRLREAELAECEAALIEAKTNLSYTVIKSPITGRFGKAAYAPGNYLTASGNPLGSIVKVSPIYVKMAISEPDYITMFGTPDAVKKDAVIRVRTADRKMFEETGFVKLVDNHIDPSTGTLMLWCQFENKSNRLIPGGVVDAFISKKTLKSYPSVPVSAVISGRQGQYVYVVDASGTAAYRPVVPGEIIGSRQIIRQGLQEGETVICDGTHKVMPGQKVLPVPAAAPGAAPAAAPASK